MKGDRPSRVASLIRGIWRVVVAHPWLILSFLAAAPFVPGAITFLRAGIPDILFDGDGGASELRMLQAARGLQMVGPYSRFLWSHPGPAFFYMALPFYAVAGERGPAINLAVLAMNCAAALGLVLAAWRLRGVVFAAIAAALLAAYEMVGVPFPLSGEWNPMVPILPLALLSLLCTRLATGSLAAMPVAAFVASAVLQTHVGFTPVAVFLFATGSALYVARAIVNRPAPLLLWRRRCWAVGASALLLGMVWVLPIYQNVTGNPGNLTELWRFFREPHLPEHTWGEAIDTVERQLAVMPAAFVGLVDGHLPSVGAALARVLAIGQVVALLAALAFSIHRRDYTCVIFAVIVLGEIMVALSAVRAIRGEINDYLVTWISVLGLLSFIAIGATAISITPKRVTAPQARNAALATSALLVLLAVRAGGDKAMFRDRDTDLEQLAAAVTQYLRRAAVARPIVTIVSHDRWPHAVGIVLALAKQSIPVSVTPDWLFLFGPAFAGPSDPEGSDHALLLIGDRLLPDRLQGCSDCVFVGAAGETVVYLQPASETARRRRRGPGRVLSAKGASGDTARAADGVVPEEGAPWDSSQSVILGSTDSFLEIAVPPGPLGGIFISAEGNDSYGVRCVHNDGTSSPLPTIAGNRGGGMRTETVFTAAVTGCRSVVVSPLKGDGLYSVGEVGFIDP
jgi:hypothetical protein